MTAKRYTIKTQDDLFGVVDNYSADKVCVINGIRTEIEAKWLCKDMNTLNDENEQLKIQLKIYKTDALETLNDLERAYENNKKALRNIEQLEGENKELRSDRDYWKTLAQSLTNEFSEGNEQLKQRIKVLEDTVDGLVGTIAHFDLDEVMWNE